MFVQIEFRHFFTQKAFCELQKAFANLDLDNRYAAETWAVPKIELKIKQALKILGEGENVFECDRDFYDDFIIPQLDYLASEHIEMVKNDWKNQNIWSKEDRKGWSEEALIMIRQGRENLRFSNYLSIEIKRAVAIQLDEFEEFLNDLIDSQDLELNPKLCFNWIRADVECFFYFLRKNKQIKELSDAQLGKIIDNVFECLPNTDSQHHTKIKGSRKHLNNLKNEDRFPDESIKRLRKVFGESFFKPKPDM
ncbi:hypothetical protein ACNR9Q_04625 [Maribacter sp. X9]|uniref:hypothetical protein n=1 Tax=Maribacter sp. X9 TaxID=3402159 RepID=UPI003AF3FCEF